MNNNRCETVTRSYNASEGAREYGRKMAREGQHLTYYDFFNVEDVIVGFDTFSLTHQSNLRNIAYRAYRVFVRVSDCEGAKKLRLLFKSKEQEKEICRLTRMLEKANKFIGLKTDEEQNKFYWTGMW